MLEDADPLGQLITFDSDRFFLSSSGQGTMDGGERKEILGGS